MVVLCDATGERTEKEQVNWIVKGFLTTLFMTLMALGFCPFCLIVLCEKMWSVTKKQNQNHNIYFPPFLICVLIEGLITAINEYEDSVGNSWSVLKIDTLKMESNRLKKGFLRTKFYIQCLIIYVMRKQLFFLC